MELLDAIDAREPLLRDRHDDALAAEGRALRDRVREGASLESQLVRCFALVRELARRRLGERPYPEQLQAGIAMHEGVLVEMATGEGKTLAAAAPVALQALAGDGAHVLTYNDYLARRDAEWMGPIYAGLGLGVGVIQEGMSPVERRRAYACDVVYATVKEAGFDLLRDGLCLDPADQVHRPFRFALVDEADSLLIDEARIPLVIAGPADRLEGDLPRLAEVVRQLEPKADFDVDEYRRNVFLTDDGMRRAEALLGSPDLFDPAAIGLLTELRSALHARVLLRRDVDYIVRDGRIELVDELTGRVAENRHWPDGLQAALEAKEGLAPRPEGRVLGSITIQHFLQRYPFLCGMTATATPAARELKQVYGLDVATVPSHRPSVRDDLPDLIDSTRTAKHAAVRREIARVHATGRPILVGTVSVEASERLAAGLAEDGIACRVLNAKRDAEEARIVAEAGAPGAVTISTNMAGRGTDIRLGGADERARDAVLALGGLYVIGTHRHESLRIDDQLRGRAGRQGDPGSSRFFVSLEDDLMRRYGIETFLPPKLLEIAGDAPIEHRKIRREVARIQRIVEGQHGEIRERLLAYALQVERQRRTLQARRQAVLDGDDDLGLLARRCPDRWRAACASFGTDTLRAVARRITLHAIDRCWSEHLAEMQAMRDENPLLKMAGEDPLVAFFRDARAAFGELEASIEQEAEAIFDRVTITADGVDWAREGLRGPSSTWTYMVNDDAYRGNLFQTLAGNPGVGAWAVLLWWPLLLAWGAVLHWRRWRARRRGARSSSES